MVVGLRDLPGSVWARVLLLTAMVVAVSTGASLCISDIIMRMFERDLTGPGLVAAIALPVLLGGPASLIHLLRLSQLRLANQQLQVLASTDSLTCCLNRRAFNELVEAQLEAGGALLVIDADHFKGINDHCGHDRGDEALRLMARSIKANLREDDTVGRIGGEEFGVFLKGAGIEAARRVAERIRAGIAGIEFAPEGARIPLSVSIGGTVFDGRIGFTQLFRIADQRLYRVKKTGRNRIDVGHIDQHAAERAA